MSFWSAGCRTSRAMRTGEGTSPHTLKASRLATLRRYGSPRLLSPLLTGRAQKPTQFRKKSQAEQAALDEFFANEDVIAVFRYLEGKHAA